MNLSAVTQAAVGRLHRADAIDANSIETMLDELAAAPIQRHPVVDLLPGA